MLKEKKEFGFLEQRFELIMLISLFLLFLSLPR